MEIPKRNSDGRTAEVKNIKVKKNQITFELNLITIQDDTNHAFDLNKTYTAKIYDLGKTKVEITSDILADAER